LVVEVDGDLQLVEEIWNRRDNAVPVRDLGRPHRIAYETQPGRAQRAEKGLHRELLFVAIEDQAVQRASSL
jgi:hypothetical protein